MAGVIYSITNTATGERYIGQTVDFAARWAAHAGELERGCSFNRRLQCAWNEYGRVAFVMDVLEEVEDPELLSEREKFWVQHYKGSVYNVALVQRDKQTGARVALTVRVPLDLYNKMRTFAANNDMTGEETMLAALRALLKEKP